MTRVEFNLDGATLAQLHGWQAHHELIYAALGLAPIGDEDTATQKNNLMMGKGP